MRSHTSLTFQVSSNVNTLGEDDAVEMFSVHATIFDYLDGGTCRRHLDLEFRSDMPLRPCLQRLLQNTGYLCRVTYQPDDPLFAGLS